MPDEKFTVKPVANQMKASSVSSDQIADLFHAVSEQNSLVEDFLRDSEEKFAELTRRMSAVEESTKNPGALLSQYSSRDTSVANSISEIRNAQKEEKDSISALRNELNKWEHEINERFITLENQRVSGGSSFAPGIIEGLTERLSEIERKLRLLDSATSSLEKLTSEISSKAEAAYSGGAHSKKISELEIRVGSFPDASELMRRLQAIEMRAAGLEISVKKINKQIILLGPHVIE